MRAPETIDVCICTFRRTEVVETIRSLAPQLGGRRRLIVIDNDDVPSGQQRVKAVCDELVQAFLYIHAPARNISIARNAALEAASAPLIAFIDDDETAAPDWLDRLEDRLASSRADVVFGSVQARYAPQAAAWLKASDLHSIRAVVHDNGEVSTGYCCNVLMRRAALGSTHFRVELGRSGGEDTFFFHELSRDGRRMVWCADALTFEVATEARARLSWLMKRFFRSGQTHALTVLDRGGSPLPQALWAGAKAAYCGLAAVSLFWSPSGWRKALVRGALHVGAVARYAGLKDLELY